MVYIWKISLKRLMKFTAVGFPKSEIATKSLRSVFDSYRESSRLFVFLTSMKITALNCKETGFPGNQCKTDGWKHDSNLKQ